MIVHDEVGRARSLIGVDDLLVVVQGACIARLADDLQIVTGGIEGNEDANRTES